MSNEEIEQYRIQRFDYFRMEGFGMEESGENAARECKKLLESIEDCGR